MPGGVIWKSILTLSYSGFFFDTRDLENSSLFLPFLLTGGGILYGNLCRLYIFFS